MDGLAVQSACEDQGFTDHVGSVKNDGKKTTMGEKNKMRALVKIGPVGNSVGFSCGSEFAVDKEGRTVTDRHRIHFNRTSPARSPHKSTQFSHIH